MKESKKRSDTTVGFINPYVVFKDPLTPMQNWKPQTEKNIMRILVNKRNKRMILFPYNFKWVLINNNADHLWL